MRFWLICCCLCSTELLEEISELFCFNPPPSEVKSKNSSLRNIAEQLPGLIISMPGSSAPVGPHNPSALPRCLLGLTGKGMPPPHCRLDPPSPGAIPSQNGLRGVGWWGTVGWPSPRHRCQQGRRPPEQQGQPRPGCWGWRRVEQGVGCQRRACQENVISLHKRCSSPTPLPQQQQLKSFSPRLSQYCHIAASVEVLGPVEGAPWVF